MRDTKSWGTCSLGSWFRHRQMSLHCPPSAGLPGWLVAVHSQVVLVAAFLGHFFRLIPRSCIQHQPANHSVHGCPRRLLVVQDFGLKTLSGKTHRSSILAPCYLYFKCSRRSPTAVRCVHSAAIVLGGGDGERGSSDGLNSLVQDSFRSHSKAKNACSCSCHHSAVQPFITQIHPRADQQKW